jgi:predicted SAM-dependent methyltransferase
MDDHGGVVGWDLANRLPLPAGTIELIYCEHFVEHLTLQQTVALCDEWYRLLQSGGKLRLSTPNLKKMIDEYRACRTTEWCDVGWSPVTPCQMMNEGLRLWGHQFTYDVDELRRVLVEAGFREVTEVAWRESGTPALRNLECRPFHGELILEATK